MPNRRHLYSAFDYRNSLIKVEDYEPNVIAEYAYDALRKRKKKGSGNIATYSIYDLQGRMIAEYKNHRLIYEFVFGNGCN